MTNNQTEWLSGFLANEATAREGIFIRKAFFDICEGSFHRAAILSQIVYWYLPNKETGESRLKVFKEGSYWIAKQHSEWEAECFVKERSAKKAIAMLQSQGLITVKYFKFNGLRTTHIKLNPEAFENAIRHQMSDRSDNIIDPIGHQTPDVLPHQTPDVLPHQTPDVRSLTEITNRDYKQKLPSGSGWQGKDQIFLDPNQDSHEQEYRHVPGCPDQIKKELPPPRSTKVPAPKKRDSNGYEALIAVYLDEKPDAWSDNVDVSRWNGQRSLVDEVLAEFGDRAPGALKVVLKYLARDAFLSDNDKCNFLTPFRRWPDYWEQSGGFRGYLLDCIGREQHRLGNGGVLPERYVVERWGPRRADVVAKWGKSYVCCSDLTTESELQDYLDYLQKLDKWSHQ